MEFAKIMDDGAMDLRYCHENDTTRMGELVSGGFMQFVPSAQPACEPGNTAVDTFTVENGKVVQHWETRVDNQAITREINELKERLAATDYQVAKCMEAQLCGEPMPYDVNAIHAQRDAWRAEINRLESVLS